MAIKLRMSEVELEVPNDVLEAHFAMLTRIENKLDTLTHVVEKRFNRLELEMDKDTESIIKRLDDATNRVASKLQALIDKATGAGSVSAAEIRAALEPEVARLEALGADPADPVPATT